MRNLEILTHFEGLLAAHLASATVTNACFDEFGFKLAVYTSSH